MRMLGLMVTAVLVMPALAACGGSSHRPKLASKASSTTTTTAAGGAGASTTIAGPGSNGAGGTQSGTNTGGGTATTVAGAPNLPPGVTSPQAPGPEVTATAKLDRTCVHKGLATDVQGVTVQMAARAPVAYESVYSDNSTEMTNKSYTTGHGYGKADDKGVYRATWVVPGSAPPGKANVYVLYSANKQPITLPFTIVPLTGSCP